MKKAMSPLNSHFEKIEDLLTKNIKTQAPHINQISRYCKFDQSFS